MVQELLNQLRVNISYGVHLSCFYKPSDSIVIQRVVIFTVYTEVMAQDKQGCYSLYGVPACMIVYRQICNNYDTMAFYRRHTVYSHLASQTHRHKLHDRRC